MSVSQTYPDTMPAVPRINPTYPRMPIPAGTVRVHDWDDTQTPIPFRYFVGSSRIVDRPHHDTDNVQGIITDR